MRIIVTILTVTCLALYSCKHNAVDKNHLLKIDISSFHGKNGWGYEIKVDHKNFIRQEFIPALAGQRGFASESDALKTAKLVVWKMKQMKSPSVTIDELKAMGIDSAQTINQN